MITYVCLPVTRRYAIFNVQCGKASPHFPDTLGDNPTYECTLLFHYTLELSFFQYVFSSFCFFVSFAQKGFGFFVRFLCVDRVIFEIFVEILPKYYGRGHNPYTVRYRLWQCWRTNALFTLVMNRLSIERAEIRQYYTVIPSII